jgi:hypothetical protein
MFAFQQALRRWEPYIKKATHASAVKYEISEALGLTITVYWIDRAGSKGQHKKVLSREDVYPRVTAGVAPKPMKKVCRFVDDIIMEVLETRGA